MSYCRFSDQDFGCDVYCYASASGIEVHVASNRLKPSEPLPPPLVGPFDAAAYVERHMEVVRVLRASERIPIGGPFDGESFTCGEAGEAADLLEEIRAAGYNVPQYAIDELREDATDAVTAP